MISADRTVVALVGRVRANVSVENGPIAAGDPLTSASSPGAAMKATHAGKIIGYALEASQSDGEALVLLQPGMYLPEGDLATQSENAQLKAQVAALDARLAALERREPGMPTWLIAGGALVIGMLLAGRFGMRLA